MNHRDLMILRELHDIKRRQSWWLDFSSNLAGNAVWDGAVWLFGKLLRRL